MTGVADCRGLKLTTGPEGARAFDDCMAAYLRLGPDAGDKLKALFAADPDMPLAHVLKGYFMMLMGSGALVPKARAAHETAAMRLSDVTDREAAHIAALGRWAARDLAGAKDIWEAILLDHPTDILAVRLAHYAHFYSGDAQATRDSINRVAAQWDGSIEGYSYVIGMRSFGWEEAGDYAKAQADAETAISLNPLDPWATHAYTHAMEMQDRHADGLKWLADLRPHWVQANNFRYHIWWHEALLKLDTEDPSSVLAFYDANIFDAASDEYLDLCNDAALLQRLEILGLDVGDRWQPLAEKVMARGTEEHLLTFIDLHFALILAASGEGAALDEMIEFQSAYEGPEEDTNLPIMKALGVPMMAALKAYRAGQYGTVTETILPVRYELWQMGGSYAQRDLFQLILIDAAMKGGENRLAQALLAERAALKPDDPWTTRVRA